jgi:hypothetical protein
MGTGVEEVAKKVAIRLTLNVATAAVEAPSRPRGFADKMRATGTKVSVM